MEEMKKLSNNNENFESLVLNTADIYIRSDRWLDAIHLLKHTETIQGSSQSESIISHLLQKIAKNAITSLDLPKAAKILSDLKIAIEESPIVSPGDKCSIYNNLSCAYKRLGKILQAKKYIDKALAIANSARVPETEKAAALLNSCSILSDMGKHMRASEQASKVIDMLTKLGNLTEPLKRLLGMAYFNYASEKHTLKDFEEAMKFFKKASVVLEKLNAEGIVEECKRYIGELKVESKQKAEFRPVSANPRAKMTSYRAAEKIPLKKYFVREKKPASAASKERKSSQNLKPSADYSLMSAEMLKYRREIDKIISRPPLRDSKAKNVSRSRIEELPNLRVTSQGSIKVLPSRPQSGKNALFTPSNLSYTLLEIEPQQNISLPSGDPKKLICEQSPITVTEEIRKEILLDEAAIKIQAIVKGFIIRKRFLVKPPDKLILRVKRFIKNKNFIVSVIENLKKHSMILLDTENVLRCFRLTINEIQIKDLEGLIKRIDFENDLPFFIEKGQQCFFKHIQRRVKKIGNENYILDCFSNENNEVLIKAKGVKSQKEFSLKIDRKPSNDIKADIDSQILPKLRIRENRLLVSQSIELPKLVFSGQKIIDNISFSISVHEEAKAFSVFAVAGAQESYTMKVSNDEIDWMDSEKVKEAGKILWDKVEIKEKRIFINTDIKENVSPILELNKKINEESKEIISIEVEEGKNEEFFKSNNEDTEENKPRIKNQIIGMADSPEINKDVKNFISIRCAKKIQQFFRSTHKKLQNFHLVISVIKHFKSSFSLQVLQNPYFFLLRSNSQSLKIPMTFLLSSAQTEKPSPKALSYYLLNSSIYFKSPLSLTTPLPSLRYYCANKIKSLFRGNLVKLRRSRGKETLKFTHSKPLQISGSQFNVKSSIYSTFVHIFCSNHSEKLNVYLKSQLLQGYPEDFPLKKILKQYVYPRLYIKIVNQHKKLHGPRKFEISAPFFSHSDPNLLLSTIKSFDSDQFLVKISRSTDHFKVTCLKADQQHSLCVPMKEMKNFPNTNLICTHILRRLQFNSQGKLWMFEENEARVYVIVNAEICGKEYAVTLNKETEKVLIHALDMINGKELILYLDKCNPDKKVESLIESLQVVEVLKEPTLIIGN